MLIIALLVPGRWDWTFGASSRDIEVSYNLLSPPLFSLPLFPKNTLAWSWFFTFSYHPPSRHPTPTHTLSTQPFPQGPERTRGCPFSPSSKHIPLQPQSITFKRKEEKGTRQTEGKRNDKANLPGRDCAHTSTCIRYLYLTFTSEDVGSLDEWVFSTGKRFYFIMTSTALLGAFYSLFFFFPTNRRNDYFDFPVSPAPPCPALPCAPAVGGKCLLCHFPLSTPISHTPQRHTPTAL